jgi:hypothetical protein
MDVRKKTKADCTQPWRGSIARSAGDDPARSLLELIAEIVVAEVETAPDRVPRRVPERE